MISLIIKLLNQTTNERVRDGFVDSLTINTRLDDTTLIRNISLKRVVDHYLKQKLKPAQYKTFDFMLGAYHRGEKLSVAEAELIFAVFVVIVI